VEEVSDLLERRLERATPNEAGNPIRENGKPLPITAWGDVTEDNTKVLIARSSENAKRLQKNPPQGYRS
jgi:hypothetical protein